MRKGLAFLVVAAAVIFSALYFGLSRTQDRVVTVHSTLPSDASAKTVLNATYRHRQWVNVEARPSSIRAFIVYPQR